MWSWWILRSGKLKTSLEPSKIWCVYIWPKVIGETRKMSRNTFPQKQRWRCWFADEHLSETQRGLHKEYEHENWCICSWIELFKKTQSPRRLTDLTSGQFGSPLDFKTVCHWSSRPDSKCTDASYQGCDTPCNQQASQSSLQTPSETTRKVLKITRLTRHQQDHSPL